MEKSKLLLVDDEPNLTSALVRSLDRTQFQIFTADSAQQACIQAWGNVVRTGGRSWSPVTAI